MTTMITERLQKIRAKCVELLDATSEKLLERHQPCGCVVCVCEDEYECHGCGAKNCGTHPIGKMPTPVYSKVTQRAGPAEAGWRATIAAIDGLIPLSEPPSVEASNEAHQAWEQDAACVRDVLGTILTAWEGIEL